MEVGLEGERGMVGNIGLLASHLFHQTRHHRPQQDFLQKKIMPLYNFEHFDGFTHMGVFFKQNAGVLFFSNIFTYIFYSA